MTVYDSHRRVPVRWSSLLPSAQSAAYGLRPFVKYHADGEDFTIVPQWFIEDFGVEPLDLSSISDRHIKILGGALGI